MDDAISSGKWLAAGAASERAVGILSSLIMPMITVAGLIVCGVMLLNIKSASTLEEAFALP